MSMNLQTPPIEPPQPVGRIDQTVHTFAPFLEEADHFKWGLLHLACAFSVPSEPSNCMHMIVF
eukprot:4060906-Amphidinium_carterae.1